ncbi:uncharacterized protein LOC122251959 [Penaeus japonicus]|uniref:uncharacterized protein LOC122251959 n=1 Tax=Penaeus japonicus TaxID=27405 RepID=UPI001C70C228|nr:uncharacterized protein LOC122251959 [Penaeus japonicus]
MTSRHQTVIIIFICFCTLTRKIHSASVKRATSSNGEGDPCTPIAVIAREAENKDEGSTLLYEVKTEGLCNTKPTCTLLNIQGCQDGKIKKRMLAKIKGSYCMSDEGCYKVTCDGVMSAGVTLPGINGISVSVTRAVFMNSSVMHLSSNAPDARVRSFHLQLSHKGVLLIDAKEALPNPATSWPIYGNFSEGECYDLYLKPVLKTAAIGCYPSYFTTSHCYNTIDEKSQPVEKRTSKNKALLVCSILLILTCIVVVLIRYRKKQKTQESHAKPKEKTSKANRVVLIHAFDDWALEERCSELAFTLTNYLGDLAKVEDIYKTRNRSLVEDPQSWVTEKILASGSIQQEEEQGTTKIVLVLSPCLVKLERALQEGEGEFDCLERAPHSNDIVLKTFLKHLSTPALRTNYQHLFLVRFADLYEKSSDDLPNLVPGKRFILPGHDSQLLEEIG